MVDVPRALDPSDAERLDVLRRAMTAGNVDGESRAVGPIFRRDQLQAGVGGAGTDAALDARDSMIDKFTITDDGTDTFTLTFDPIEDSWNVTLVGVGQVDTDDYTIDGQTLTVADAAALFLGCAHHIAAGGAPWVLQVQYDYLTGVPVAPTDGASSDLSIVSVFSHDSSGDAPLGTTADAGDLLLSFCSGGPTAPPGWTLERFEANTLTTTKLYSKVAAGGETVCPYGEPGPFGAFQVVVRGGGAVITTGAGTAGAGTSIGMPTPAVLAGDLLFLAANGHVDITGLAVDFAGTDVTVLGSTLPSDNNLTVGTMVAPSAGTAPAETAQSGSTSAEWTAITAVVR